MAKAAIDIRFSQPMEGGAKKGYSKPGMLHSVKAPFLRWKAFDKLLNSVYSKVSQRGGSAAGTRALAGVKKAVSSDPTYGVWVAEELRKPGTLGALSYARERGGERAPEFAVARMLSLLWRNQSSKEDRLSSYNSFIGREIVGSYLELARSMGREGNPVYYVALGLPGRLEPHPLCEALSMLLGINAGRGKEAAGEIAFEVCLMCAKRGSPGLENAPELLAGIHALRAKTGAGVPVRNAHGVLEWLPEGQQNI